MVKVYVMDTCPDCYQVKEQAKHNSGLEIIDIGEHVRNLKAFLRLRDNHPAFEVIRQKGSIGIPCFVFEDGSVSFSLPEQKLQNDGQAQSCSLDGKGC
ncbi:MAG: hypothetical protein ACI350_00415 [Prevotella sp.]